VPRPFGTNFNSCKSLATAKTLTYCDCCALDAGFNGLGDGGHLFSERANATRTLPSMRGIVSICRARQSAEQAGHLGAAHFLVGHLAPAMEIIARTLGFTRKRMIWFLRTDNRAPVAGRN